MTSPADFRQAARYYITKGWPVFPVHALTGTGSCTCGDPACDKPGKHPSNNHGHLEATLDFAEVDRMWTGFVHRNIGIATGFQSHLAVIDIDARHEGFEAWEEFTKMFPEQDFDTISVNTGGGGLHLYYYIDRSVPTIINLLQGVDLKADGGYVIAPPSMHASGGQYLWPHIQPEQRLLPISVLGMVQTGARPAGLKITPQGVVGFGMTAERQREILNDPTSLGPGERDTFFTFTARDLVRGEKTFEEVVRTLANVWDRMTNPPDDFFSQEQLIDKVRRAFDTVDPTPTRENRELAQSLINSLPAQQAAEIPQPGTEVELAPLARKVIHAPDDYQLPVEIWEHWNGELPVPWVPNDIGVAALAKLQWGHFLRFDLERERWLYYDRTENLWVEQSDHIAYRLMIATVLSIERVIAMEYDDEVRDKFVQLAYSYSADARIKAALRALGYMDGISIHHDELDAFNGRLPVLNGVLEPDAVEDVGPSFQPFEEIPFHPHSPEDLFTRHANMKYDPDAHSPFWENAVRDWFPNHETREFVQRVMGYALFGAGQEKILVVANGKKHSGKSAFVTNVEALFGSFASALSADDVTTDRRMLDDKSFKLAHLPGAKLITVAETAPNRAYNTELLKLLSSGGEDPIRAAFKYKDFFTFRNKGLLMIMTNHLPANDVMDDALWARIVIIPFDAYFDPNAPGTIKLNDFKRLVQSESDGVLRWFLDGYEAYQRMGLAIPGPVLETIEKARAGEDWMTAYIESRLQPDPLERTLCKDVYPDYVAWALTGMENEPVSKKEFNRLMKEHFRLKRGTGNAYYFHGFKLLYEPMSTGL